MTREIAYQQYHHWLEHRSWSRADELPFSVGLEGSDSGICGDLGAEVAAYLSDNDPFVPGGWLYFGTELVSRVATAKGISALSQAFPEISTRASTPCGERRCGFLADIARLGGAVLYLPDACRSLRGHPDLFVAGVRCACTADAAGSPQIGGDLTIDLDRIGRDTAVRVIADSALEWAVGRCARPENVTPWKSSS